MDQIINNAMYILVRLYEERNTKEFFSFDEFSIFNGNSDKELTLQYLREQDLIDEGKATKCKPNPIRISLQGLEFYEKSLCLICI